MEEEGKRPKSMDIREMWSLTNREENSWGIEGYEVPKKYNDAKKQILDRKNFEENLKVWSKKGHYEKKQKLDKEGNPIVLKRPNYLDEVSVLNCLRLLKWQIHFMTQKEQLKYWRKSLLCLRKKRSHRKMLSTQNFTSRKECFTQIGLFYSKRIRLNQG